MTGFTEYAVYKISDGEILRFCSAPTASTAIEPDEGEAIAVGTGSDVTHYVDTNTDPHEIKPKADYTIDALPLPCTALIEGVVYECTEQPTFEFNYPGSYEITISAGPSYLQKTFEVTQE